MRVLKLLLILLVCAAALPAVAGPYEDAIAAYEKGDYAPALRLWRALADQGDAAAQNKLGLMFLQGRGVPQNYSVARSWFRKAAEQGLANGQNNLGEMYGSGAGVSQDNVAAVSWYRKAAEQGDALGQRNLGVKYLDGLGVRQDYVQAHVWLNLAVSRFDASEKDAADRARKTRDDLAAKMTSVQIAVAQKLASEWKPKQER